MKNIKKRNCPEEWMIQAYIDGELEGDGFSDTKNHIASCEVCQKIVETRKQKLLNLMESLDEPIVSKQLQVKYKPFKIVAWSSVAASIIIVATISLWFMKAGKTDEETLNCEWVVLNEKGFDPQFVSPNKLYNKRLIEIKEVDATGNVTLTYLEKHCSN